MDMKPEPRQAYSYTQLWEIAAHLFEPVHDHFCAQCGAETVVFEVDLERWDKLCWHCRSWTQGTVAWFLRFFGWELRRVRT